MNFVETLTTTKLSSDDARRRTQLILADVLDTSQHLDQPNFTSIHSSDIEYLAHKYDEVFFGGQLMPLANAAGITFRLSRRMTKAGGTTTKRRYRPGARKTKSVYEIAVSITLLYQTFEDVERPITMSGIRCTNRLEALQRVMEHELVHLAELLMWDDSSCSAPRFQNIAHNFFAHTEHKHTLITQRERAYAKFGIRSGDFVSFQFEGQSLAGFVNRITRRATILVEDPRGVQYSDGRSYMKYYVPIEALSVVADNSPKRRPAG